MLIKSTKPQAIYLKSIGTIVLSEGVNNVSDEYCQDILLLNIPEITEYKEVTETSKEATKSRKNITVNNQVANMENI